MAAITEVWSYRGLIGNLAQRELKSRYKRSVLGWLWSLLNPASTLLIYTVVFGTIMRIEPPIAGNGTTKSFALFLFSALVVWNFFSSVLTGSMGALLGAGGLLKKVYFPPECPPIANALTVLTQTALEAIILLVVLAFVGNLSWTVVFFPYLVAMLALFSLGIGLVLSLLNVYMRDINYLVSIGLNLLFYGTPIIYPFSLLVNNDVPQWIQNVVQANPLTQFVGASQQIFYLQEVPSLARLAGITAAGVVSFALGWAIFSAKSLDVSEEL
jgi:ABC-type polysaccharide/polyol phosphate export permease